MVECLVWDQDAAGSSPVTSTKKDTLFRQGEDVPFLFGKVCYYGFKAYHIKQTIRDLNVHTIPQGFLVFE